MKDMLKKTLCLVMALSMFFTLAACGEEEEESASRRRRKRTEDTSDTTEARSADRAFLYEGRTPEKEATEETPTKEHTEMSNDAQKLVGTWVTEVDASDFMSDMLYEKSGIDLTLEDFVLSMTMTFNEDGTVTAEGDASRAVAAMAIVIDELWEEIIKSIAEQTGMSIEEVEKMMEQQGMTKEVLAEQNGPESMFGTEDEMTMSAKWLLDENELYVGEDDPEDEDPVVIEFKGSDEFHIVEVPDDPDDIGQYLLPLVFKRVG